MVSPYGYRGQIGSLLLSTFSYIPLLGPDEGESIDRVNGPCILAIDSQDLTSVRGRATLQDSGVFLPVSLAEAVWKCRKHRTACRLYGEGPQ